jgi:hypothetical protein
MGPSVLGTSFVAGGSFAATGLSLLWWVVAAFTLIVAGLALIHLFPRRER